MDIARRIAAEFIGTFWLVLGGCGAAVIAAEFPDVGVGFLGVALAFGLAALTGTYAFGHISGGHFNPAVTAGVWAGGRFPSSEVLPYWGAQVSGGIAGAGVLYLIASSALSFDPAAGFASNGFGNHSPGGYSLLSALIVEIVMTAMFVLIVLAATSKRMPEGFAPIAIGLALTLIYVVSLPVTNGAVNPARSTGPAVFIGGWALEQLWLFWIAPLVGAVAAGYFNRWLDNDA